MTATTSPARSESLEAAKRLTPAQFKAKYGPWAVIAGASDGTGAAFAGQLAALGLNLVLIARREKPLAELAERLARSADIQIQTLQLDLALPGAADRMLTAAAPCEVGLYVSNAGADPTGAHFIDRPIQSWRELIQRNVVTLTEACHGFAGKMLPRGHGGLILMGSGAGLGGQPRVAIYSATKGFDLNLGESLWAELKPRGIDVLSVVAPAMNTETLQRVTRARGIEPAGLIEPDAVARSALTQLPQGPACVFSSGFDLVGPDELAQNRRQRVIAVSEATRMFYGEA
jgi:short-subunit dehydrogenase